MIRPVAAMFSVTLLMAMLASAPPAAGQQTPKELATRVAGCYELEIGPWPDALDRDYHPDPQVLPRRLRLDTVRFATARRILSDSVGQGQQQGRRESRAFMVYDSLAWDFRDWRDWMEEQFPENPAQFFPERLWYAEGPDSLSIRAPIMFAGFRWRFRREGERLRGRVISSTDYIREDKPSSVTAPAVARPIPCPPER